MEDLDLMSLAEAADELGIAPVTLRAAIGRGRFRARKFGNTWVTTRGEVDRYRDESLGKVGRPPTATGTGTAYQPTILTKPRPPFEDVLGKPGEPNVFRDRPDRD